MDNLTDEATRVLDDQSEMIDILRQEKTVTVPIRRTYALNLHLEIDELRAENDRLRAELYELEAELAHLPTDVSAQNYVAYSEQTIKTLLDALWPFAKAHQESVEWYDALDRVGERDFVNARKMYSGIKGE